MVAACLHCGAPVDVLCNPLDSADPRPLCYDCAIADAARWSHARPYASLADVARAVANGVCTDWPDRLITHVEMMCDPDLAGGRRSWLVELAALLAARGVWLA
jgi:hypothetical protein